MTTPKITANTAATGSLLPLHQPAAHPLALPLLARHGQFSPPPSSPVMCPHNPEFSGVVSVNQEKMMEGDTGVQEQQEQQEQQLANDNQESENGAGADQQHAEDKSGIIGGDDAGYQQQGAELFLLYNPLGHHLKDMEDLDGLLYEQSEEQAEEQQQQLQHSQLLGWYKTLDMEDDLDIVEMADLTPLPRSESPAPPNTVEETGLYGLERQQQEQQQQEQQRTLFELAPSRALHTSQTRRRRLIREEEEEQHIPVHRQSQERHSEQPGNSRQSLTTTTPASELAQFANSMALDQPAPSRTCRRNDSGYLPLLTHFPRYLTSHRKRQRRRSWIDLTQISKGQQPQQVYAYCPSEQQIVFGGTGPGQVHGTVTPDLSSPESSPILSRANSSKAL